MKILPILVMASVAVGMTVLLRYPYSTPEESTKIIKPDKFMRTFEICHDGVTYIQFSAGRSVSYVFNGSVAYTVDGKIKLCKVKGDENE